MNIQQSSTLSLTAFTLYPITLAPIKTCYQSQSHKILCLISGPYYDRTSNIDPTFQLKITSNQNLNDKFFILVEKLRQTLNNVVVKEKYHRMKFDISFDVVESQSQNTSAILSPLVNLLCYTVVLNGIQVKSLFTCCGLSLVNQKKLIVLSAVDDHQDLQKKEKSTKSMILGVQHLNKQNILAVWQGQFVFLHYQRLANTLLICNDQIQLFIRQKINEAYQQFTA